jgi:hypothetical protein
MAVVLYWYLTMGSLGEGTRHKVLLILILYHNSECTMQVNVW